MKECLIIRWSIHVHVVTICPRLKQKKVHTDREASQRSVNYATIQCGTHLKSQKSPKSQIPQYCINLSTLFYFFFLTLGTCSSEKSAAMQ